MVQKIGLLVVDLQEGFNPSADLVDRIKGALALYEEVAFTRFVNPPESLFRSQLHWFENGGPLCLSKEGSLVLDKSGYGLTAEHINALRSLGCAQWHLVGVETDACVMACAFSLFDAGIPVKIVDEACESDFHFRALPLLIKQFGAFVGLR